MNRLELWGGIECTINRVGDRFYNQTALSGHDHRRADIEQIACLGIRTLRYPVLWESTAPQGVANADWRVADERLPLLREHGITPIVGLLHHGSGPLFTSLVDPGFPQHFAEYAGAVAARFPWICHYTPINEPLTTARFSALYGHWYPHRRDDRSFVRALLNQCAATVLAMGAIRKFNPDAQLIQTDDLGKTFSTRSLAYQARFDNRRRWLAWDLLCGRVDADHPLRKYLLESGARPRELDWLVEKACSPDMIGVNHYVTSNRYLHQDERWSDREHWGGNGRETYGDTEAVRVLDGRGGGLDVLLNDAWQRYRIPLAVTEVHLGCSRDEQLRWLHDAWKAAQNARIRGVDVRAVTAWALYGSFDWDSLLTQFPGHYEPGAFDVRGPGMPRRTALGRLIGELANGRDAPGSLIDGFPALGGPGWWRRDSRFLSGCAGVHVGPPKPRLPKVVPRPVLIAGAGGTLGHAFARICEERGLEHVACTRPELDISSHASIAAALDEIRPWAVINAAGYVRIDAAEADFNRCYRENRDGAVALARACESRGMSFLTFSTDMVFDGEGEVPYVESDPVRPLNVYGRSKADAETRVLNCYPGALVVRTSAFFGPWDRCNFVTLALDSLETGGDFSAAEDLIVSPTYVPDLAHASLDLLLDGESGIWHLANRGAVSWAALAHQAARQAGIEAPRVVRSSLEEGVPRAARPRYSALGTERGVVMPDLEDALARYVLKRAS